MGATIPKDRRTPPIVNENSVHESTFKVWVGGKRKSATKRREWIRGGSRVQLRGGWVDRTRVVSARNFPNFWRTITLAYYHYKLWGPFRIHYYRATMPFIDTISHTSIVFSAFKKRVTDRGPFPQFQQHQNRIKKIEHYYSPILSR